MSARTRTASKTTTRKQPAKQQKGGATKQSKAPSKLSLLRNAAASKPAVRACPGLGLIVDFSYISKDRYSAAWKRDGEDYEIRGTFAAVMLWIGCAIKARQLDTNYPAGVIEYVKASGCKKEGVAA